MRMSTANIIPISMISAAVFIIFLTLSFLLLPACAVNFPNGTWFGQCKEVKTLTNVRETPPLDEIQILNQKIAQLERSLLSKECIFEKETVAIVDGAITEKSLNQEDLEAWSQKDLTFLSGCWVLEGSELTFVDVNTDEISTSSTMQVCFQEASKGTIELALEGASCRGDAKASFSQTGDLVLTDTQDITCDDGYRIFKSITTCRIDSQSVANCVSRQPSTGGENNYILVRK